jgi:hypothetical protein
MCQDEAEMNQACADDPEFLCVILCLIVIHGPALMQASMTHVIIIDECHRALMRLEDYGLALFVCITFVRPVAWMSPRTRERERERERESKLLLARAKSYSCP